MDALEMLWAGIVWIAFGLFVGALARLIHPGRDPIGFVRTIALGMLGSLLGGGAWYLWKGGDEPYSPAGFLLALISAIILLALGLFADEKHGR